MVKLWLLKRSWCNQLRARSWGHQVMRCAEPRDPPYFYHYGRLRFQRPDR